MGNIVEKIGLIIICWIVTAITFIMMIPMIPKNMILIVIAWKIWFFIIVPIIIMVAQKLGC